MIPLQETEFDFEAINDQIIGAGILPIAVDLEGKVRFLLGKERYINHWRGSLKWSGFEGGRKSGEDIVRTAAREFIEESIGAVRIGTDEPSIESVIDHIRTGQYVARIVLCILHGGDDHHDKRYHVTYLVQVPYDASCMSEFIARRRMFVEMQHRGQQMSKMYEQIVEHEFPLEGAVFNGHRVSTVVRAERVDGSTLRVEFTDETRVGHVFEMTNLDEGIVDAYVKWHGLRLQCTEDCRSPRLQRGVEFRVNAQEVVTHVRINEDYIEKQSVQWWTLDELREVLRNGGYAQNEFFRAYFLPVLQRAVQEIDRIHPS